VGYGQFGLGKYELAPAFANLGNVWLSANATLVSLLALRAFLDIVIVFLSVSCFASLTVQQIAQ
jgi:hypothetical protein